MVYRDKGEYTQAEYALQRSRKPEEKIKARDFYFLVKFLYSIGNYNDALKVCDECLDTDSCFKKAINLKNKIFIINWVKNCYFFYSFIAIV